MYYTLEEKISFALMTIYIVSIFILWVILLLFVSLAAYFVALIVFISIGCAVDCDDIADNLARKIVKTIDERKKIKNSIHF